MKVNKNGLAKIFGASLPTVSKWVDRGCPCEKTEKEVMFSTVAVVEWFLGEKPTLSVINRRSAPEMPEALDGEYQKARKDKELADKTAMENSIRRGEVVEAKAAEAAWAEMVLAAKAKLLPIGGALAPILAAETSAAKIKKEIDSAVRGGLLELSGRDD